MRCVFWILTIFLVLNNVVAFGDDPKQAARSLVNWGSFDGALSDNGLPAGWDVYPVGSTQYDCYTVTDVSRSPPRGLRVASRVPWTRVIAAQLPVEAGTQQAGKAWVRSIPGSDCEWLLRIDYLNEAGVTIGSSPTVSLRPPPGTGDAEWKLIAVEGNSAAFPQAKRLIFVAQQKEGGVAVWDDFDFRQFTASDETNLLNNGGFELLAGNEFPGWRLFTTEPVDVRLSPIFREPLRGWLSVRIVGEAKSAVLSTNRLPIKSGTGYRLGGWHSAVAGTGQFKLVFWKEGMHIATVRSTKPARAEWSASDDVVAPAETVRDATHVTVEYEMSGKFDVAVDALRLRAE
ncbi:MAG TPA: hypothetical protein VL132_17335 [Planctomycetaceae bacterium]|nr:hypothetical protein [Planctomycetaceae bacterium]